MIVDRFELPERAQKIQKREREEIVRRTEEAMSRPASAASVLTTVARLLNLRQRYMGAIGEHYSVQHYEGIQVVDALDQELLEAVFRVLGAFLERTPQAPPAEAVSRVEEFLTEFVRELPQYPVGFMVLFVLREAIERFDEIREAVPGLKIPDQEHGLLVSLYGFIDRFLQTRALPIQRHFSDVEREYSCVNRLKCNCGEEKYQIAMQSLHVQKGGMPFDQLDLQCSSCGARRSVTFDLPYFKDMYQL